MPCRAGPWRRWRMSDSPQRNGGRGLRLNGLSSGQKDALLRRRRRRARRRAPEVRALRGARATPVLLLALIAMPASASATGATLIKNINPGAASSAAYGFTGLGGKVYFEANDGTHGYELWRTDGTKAGTTLVKDINPGGA